MLSIVGLGYNVSGQVTPETRSVLEQADRLFYLVTDPAMAAWLRGLRPGAVSLHDSYRPGERGVDASHAMVERILEALSPGASVCAAFSGHPAICMHTAHEAIRRATERGEPVRTVPAISFEDCLVAELGVDPGQTGRMMYEATDFVLRPRTLDTTAALVLLQVGAIGERIYREGDEPNREGLRVLQETLERTYPGDFRVTLFEMSQLPIGGPSQVRLPIAELATGPVHIQTTLYAPPLAPPSRDRAMAERLGVATPASSP